MRFCALLIASFAALLLAGCGSHATDYLKKGGEVSSLVVPVGVPPLKQESLYPIPAVSQTAAAKPNSLLPPTLQKK